MPIRKFHSLEEARRALWVRPGTPEHSRALRSVFWLAARFCPAPQVPPGVFKYRTLEEAQAHKKCFQGKAL